MTGTRGENRTVIFEREMRDNSLAITTYEYDGFQKLNFEQKESTIKTRVK
jgi:hypothetical protein